MGNIIATIKNIIANEEFAKGLIETAIKRIKAKDFENAMKNRLDPSRLILNHFHSIIEQPQVKSLAQFALRLYWREIESYLTNVQKVYDLLCLNPELKEILKKEEARRYLNFACSGAYYRLYKWVWFGENPYA
jgi:hypothetical protein